jgi:hypothetical protein
VKRHARRSEFRRLEETPFDWIRRFQLQYIGQHDMGAIEGARQKIKRIDETGTERRNAIGCCLVETIRRTAVMKAGVGKDCMAVMLWMEEGDIIASAEFLPHKREWITVDSGGRHLEFPEAYSPWFLSPLFVAGPAVVKGDGGWIVGNIHFRIHAPDSRGDQGPRVYFGSQRRLSPPS